LNVHFRGSQAGKNVDFAADVADTADTHDRVTRRASPTPRPEAGVGMADVDAEAAIVAHETRVESKAQAKRFTVYKVQVNLNGVRWAVYRRYSDFYTLHQKVGTLAYDPGHPTHLLSLYPSLPLSVLLSGGSS
jgi:hypothetical protein